MSEKKLTPFNILFGIPGRKQLFSEEQVIEAGLNPYLLIQFLASNNIGIHIASYLCKYHKMKIYDMYLFSFFTLPSNIRNVKWVKREKNTNDEDIDLYQDWYGCNPEVARMYLDISSKDDLDKIREQTSVGGVIKGRGKKK